MPVSLRDARMHAPDRAWIGAAYHDYFADLRVRSTGIFPMLGAIGLTEPDPVQDWLAQRGTSLLTILDAGLPAGFALVRHEDGRNGVDCRMTEFFIARTHRRRGIGRAAARLILDRFAGRWEVVQDAANREAIAFWRNVVAAYTRGDYRERSGGGETRQFFTSTNSEKR
jgi:predicted acetyltransferase